MSPGAAFHRSHGVTDSTLIMQDVINIKAGNNGGRRADDPPLAAAASCCPAPALPVKELAQLSFTVATRYHALTEKMYVGSGLAANT